LLRQVLIFAGVIVLAVSARAQNSFAWDPLQIDSLWLPAETGATFHFPDTHRPQIQSLEIKRGDDYQQANRDFVVDETGRSIRFFNLPKNDTLRIRYRMSPIQLKQHYVFFRIDTLKTKSGEADSITVARPGLVNPFADTGSRLQKSGSIVRGVRVGNNRDLTLNSGLNLQLSGYLTDDIEVVAALTDESTPIQPEGNTQTLREIDKVFIQFKSPWVQGTLGDFNLQYTGSRFADLSRKLQGITLSGNYSSQTAGVTVATTRGFFHRISLVGREGNQGPYQLTGKNGEREIIVLAGTERIYINGELMVRGENNDYIIEYGSGQITFTNRRLITSESRIEIDFEYYPALQKYTRNVYSGMAGGNVAGGLLHYDIRYYQEEDDPTKILEAEGILTDAEKAVLAEAGDNPLAATVPAADFVGAGAGYYARRDTVVNGEALVYYKYLGRNLGAYNVSFASVGTGNGAYVRDRLGVYRFVGPARGSYLPVRLLPLPNRHRLTDLRLRYQPWRNFSLRSEYAVSQLDRNVMSALSDNDNTGFALNLGGELQESELNAGATRLGTIGFDFELRKIDANFNSVDRLNRPDFQRYWNLSATELASNAEQSAEFSTRYKPWQPLRLSGSAGSLRRAGLQSSRYQGQVDFQQTDWVTGQVQHESVETRRDGDINTWVRQKGNVLRDVIWVQPQLLIEHEKRTDQSQNGTGGFEFVDYGARLALINLDYFSGFVQYNQRNDDIFDPARDGLRIPQATTRTRHLHLEMAEWEQTTATLDVVVRDKDFTPFFENTKVDTLKMQLVDASLQDTVWTDRETNLAELTVSHNSWKRALNLKVQYKISTEQLALREKVYLDVGEGRGNLRFDEEFNEYVPDPDGNYVLYILPSGRFEPVTNLESAVRLDLDPARVFKTSMPGIRGLLANVSSETYFRVEEESKDPTLSNIYMMNLGTFQQQYTVKGSIILNQDVNLFKRDRDFSIRMRYRYRDDRFNQYLDANENEDRLTLERGIQFTYSPMKLVRAQTELRQKFTLRDSKANRSRNRDIHSTILNQNISWRPDNNWEIGSDSESGLERDVALAKNLYLYYVVANLRLAYSFIQKGRIIGQYEYQTVNVIDNPENSVVPFEMARGKREGISKNWQIRGEYTVAENVVISLFYSGRDDADFDRVIHTGQAEIRAYF
jgi:hypothetical protein